MQNKKMRGYNMKILLINGSPRKDSNTELALKEVAKSLNEEGIDTEIITLSNNVPGCKACTACYKLGKCVIDDIVNEVAAKFKEADGIVVGSPTYYASTNGTVISFLDRLFYSASFDKSMKVGAAVCIARRAGTDTNFDVINKYFTISNMVVVGSQYWNNAFGTRPGEASQDDEGMQTMRRLGKNMAFLVKSIKDGKEKYKINFNEEHKFTNFIR